MSALCSTREPSCCVLQLLRRHAFQGANFSVLCPLQCPHASGSSPATSTSWKSPSDQHPDQRQEQRSGRLLEVKSPPCGDSARGSGGAGCAVGQASRNVSFVLKRRQRHADNPTCGMATGPRGGRSDRGRLIWFQLMRRRARTSRRPRMYHQQCICVSCAGEGLQLRGWISSG